MPNHITNKILVKDKNVLNEIINYMTDDKDGNNDEMFTFEKIIPMPDYIYQGLLGQQERQLYGNDNWYDWSLQNWGTKWDAYHTYLDNENRITFDTAWTGVPKLIGILSQKFPNTDIVYNYADEDAGINTGYYVFNSGSVIENRDMDFCSYSAYKTYIDCKELDKDFYKLYVNKNEDIRLVCIAATRLK